MPESFTVEPEQARDLVRDGAPVFDIRPAAEQELGRVQGAVSLDPDNPGQALLEAGLEPGDTALVCCLGGVRSQAVVAGLRASGHTGVFGVAGGFRAWQASGLPCEYPCGLGPDELNRYARQLVLPQVGARGQARLLESRVLLIGAGGLGSPAALYLAAAGVGHLGIVDDDKVERSNLQRQILHTDAATGSPKTESARQRILALNPDVEVTCFQERLDRENAGSLLEGWDVVLDGSDNQPTRYLVNEFCVRNGIPLVYGAVSAFDGQVGVLHPHAGPGAFPCYRCLFPPSVDGEELPDCNVAGVLGVLPGAVGVLQAAEAFKLLLGVGEPLLGRLLLLDLLNMQFRTIRAAADAECPVCAQSTQD